MLLKNKTALITGGANGIGKAIASLFLEHGATVILLDIDLKSLEEFRIQNQEYNDKIFIYEADVSDENILDIIATKCRLNNLNIDIIVNNAGIMQDATLLMVRKQMIEDIYKVNVFGTIYASKAFMTNMFRTRNGSIINVSSIIGTNGNSSQSIYGSSKAAIIGFTKSLSKELAQLNIRVNAVAPGFIDTNMTKEMNQKYYNKNIDSIGMKRIGKPIDVANVILFLASDLSKYVTGQVIGIDGGMII
jgi:3-oxoacyl-[acyl-carrier protein] reductase